MKCFLNGNIGGPTCGFLGMSPLVNTPWELPWPCLLALSSPSLGSPMLSDSGIRQVSEMYEYSKFQNTLKISVYHLIRAVSTQELNELLAACLQVTKLRRSCGNAAMKGRLCLFSRFLRREFFHPRRETRLVKMLMVKAHRIWISVAKVIAQRVQVVRGNVNGRNRTLIIMATLRGVGSNFSTKQVEGQKWAAEFCWSTWRNQQSKEQVRSCWNK